MHQYRWHSNIKWGPCYSPERDANFASATDAETLCQTYGPIDLQTLQIQFGNEWRWATGTPVHLGGIAKHWHGERV